MISQTETAGANQYGFYAVPKALEPKKKYRDNDDEDYEQNDDDENQNNFLTIEDRQVQNQKQLERDYYVDQAPYPEFKPKERGLDYGVQIQRGDLFDFDLEVKPLIEILIGRSVVTALNELQQQKQKQQRRQNLEKYQKKRNAELMVTQRLQNKHKRKLQQSQRRKLQKQLYVKSQHQVGKKIISRRNAKQSLLGLKDDIISQLDDLGYLKSQPVSDLKIQYQEWLYSKIIDILTFKKSGEVAVHNTINQQEREILKEHNSYIQTQMARRKEILDERQRVNKQNEERKQKRRIKKMRKRLNSERQGDFIKFQELMERYQQINGILKFNERSSGLVNESASRASAYISGGLDNFFVALLQSSSKQFTAQEIEALIYKIITESGKQFQFSLLSQNFDKLDALKKRMIEQKAQFMRDKDNQLEQITQKLSLDLSLLEATNINIKSKLHNNFIKALISIYLTVQPQQTEENPFELSDIQKKRLQFADKIKIVKQQENLLQRIERVDRLLRVHFQIYESAQQSQKMKTQQTQQKQSQWIDIYDGEGWQKRKQVQKKELNKSQQSASAYQLNGFQNSFVIDQRVLYYLQVELQKLLELSGGQKIKQYCENLSNLKSRIKKEIPVFDAQLYWHS